LKMHCLLVICLIAVTVISHLDAAVTVSSATATSSISKGTAAHVRPPVVESIKGEHSHDLGSTEDHHASIFSTVNEKGEKVLTYYGLMLAGAIARSVSATAVHPLNVIKTLLQTKGGVMPELRWSILSRGAGSQLIMSIPHGAVSFGVTETTKIHLSRVAQNSTLLQRVPSRVLNPMLDFLSSSISTFICSIISTPQMVLTDRIMAGVYEHFLQAICWIYKTEGLAGFYVGWFPALVQKIPSYALTWMFFQQLKQAFLVFMDRPGSTLENTLIGSLAAAGACCVMIPVDTVKTRIVTQRPGTEKHYSGMVDCFVKIIDSEGVGALYKALPPRLMAVVPMIGIQFGVYELVKRLLVEQPPPKQRRSATAVSTPVASK